MYTLFKDLLGNPPVVTAEEEIPQIFEELSIMCDAFDEEEYQNPIKEVKNFETAFLLLTKCEIDDII